jgi:hypothetical protein
MDTKPHLISRRQFATAAALTCGLGCGIEVMAALPPRDVGRKLNADGTVRGFAGNTFVGHIGQQGEDFAVFDKLLNIYRDVPRYSFAGKLALLPPSSYHVTVFGGLNEADRGTSGWPASLAPDLGLEVATQAWLHKLRTRPRLNDAAFLFELDSPPPNMSEGAPNIPLRPADDATAERLITLRDDLSRLTGIRRADHDRYQYHLTFGYLYRHLTAVQADELRDATISWMSSMPRKLRISGIQFCSFRDMYAFRVLHDL